MSLYCYSLISQIRTIQFMLQSNRICGTFKINKHDILRVKSHFPYNKFLTSLLKNDRLLLDKSYILLFLQISFSCIQNMNMITCNTCENDLVHLNNENVDYYLTTQSRKHQLLLIQNYFLFIVHESLFCYHSCCSFNEFSIFFPKK